MDEPLIDYTNYINLQNVLKNFMINDEIQVLDLKFINNNILDVIVNSNITNNYIINNIVHYIRIGELPPEPITTIDKTDSFLYQFNDIVPYNDISSCFIYYDISYNSQDISNNFIKNNFLIDLSSFNYKLSTDVIVSNNTQFIIPMYLLDEDVHEHTFGGVINNYDISNVIYNGSSIKFIIPNNLVFDSEYYYIINNHFIDISNISLNKQTININWDYGDVFGIINLKQVIIEKYIIKPYNNQLCNITLSESFDLNNDGYLQATDKYGNELGQYVYKFDISINEVDNTLVYINNNNLISGQIIYVNPLCIITNEIINTINSILILDTNTTYYNVNISLIQKTYIPFNLYKSVNLTQYKIFISEDNVFNDNDFTFNTNSINYYSLISRYATFKLEKVYDNQQLLPTPYLVPTESTSVEIITTTNQTYKFNNDLYKKLFESIEFMIGDQSIETLNEDIFNVQYQFFKDDHLRKMFDKVVKIYQYENQMRLIIPLEFWFSYTATLAVPLITLQYVDVSLKIKLNDLNYIIGDEYTIINKPEINIQVNIDGIILDTYERELFAKNNHEYIIERFKQYPDSLLDNIKTSNRLLLKNLIKDIYFITQIYGSTDNVFYKTQIIQDSFQLEYINKRALYDEFIKVGVYTNTISSSNSADFAILRFVIGEAKNKSSQRYIAFMNSPIISKYDITMSLYLDSKYQSFTNLIQNVNGLHVYYSKIYKHQIIKTPISPINSMHLSAGCGDLLVDLNSGYYNLVVPYQKYNTSVDEGYYGYSFALEPLVKQPSGHLNFSVLDNIVVNSTNNSLVVNKPVILKTIVKEYQIIRMMSGLASLVWTD